MRRSLIAMPTRTLKKPPVELPDFAQQSQLITEPVTSVAKLAHLRERSSAL